MTENKEIESMEHTFQSKTEGTWMFIVKKKDRDSVMSFLENKIEELIPGNPKITCIGAKAPNTEQTTKALGSYIDVLRGFTNPQDDNLSTGSKTQKEMTMNPYQKRKRQYITVKTGMTIQSV